MKLLLLLLVALLACVVNGFRAHSAFSRVRKLPMTKIVDGVEFNTIAREWRLKWSANDDKKSLADVQRTLDSFKSDLHKVFGVKSVQRVVCGGCLDYKVIVALDESKFADWAAASFAPEEAFLSAVKQLPGVSQVETQTYTLMDI